MLKILKISLAICILCIATNSLAISEPAKKMIPDPKKVGEGDLSIFFWDIYNAKLYTEDGEYSKGDDLILKIEYYRSINGEDIAERSAEEIEGQGFSDEPKLTKWENLMKEIFPDVSDGDILEGVFAKGKTIFFYNGKKVGETEDKEFGEKFFGIWLSSNTSEPRFRKKLLGQYK